MGLWLVDDELRIILFAESRLCKHYITRLTYSTASVLF